jgi:hypothetical protein
MLAFPCHQSAKPSRRFIKQKAVQEADMRFHLQSSHLVAMIAIALLTALLLAVRFRPATWRGIVCEAVIANVGAILAVIAFEMLTA